MQVDMMRLHRYHNEGKVRMALHPDLPLSVWTYSQSTVFNREWDDLTLICRGLVTEPDGTVVSRPFPKFFNWGEPLAPTEAEMHGGFYGYDKMDGSLIIVSNYQDGIVVSTKGSFETWHSEKARELVKGFTPLEGTTALFEFIDPANRIVIDYGDYSGLVLLGAVDIETGRDDFIPHAYADQSGWWGDVVAPRRLNLQSTLRMVADPENGPNREGFVLVKPSTEGPSKRVKLKFAQYIHLHSVLTRLTNVSIWESLKSGTFETLLELIPDEMYDKIQRYASDVMRDVSNILSDARVVVETANARYVDRKGKAAHILKYSQHPGICFNILDGKVDLATEKAYDAVRPKLSESWTYLK